MCFKKLYDLNEHITYKLSFWVTPLLLLAARIFVAQDFWKSGQTKLGYYLDGQQDTLYFLFQEYGVPFLSVENAALFGTISEVLFSILLAFGFLGRFAALGLICVSALIFYVDQNASVPFWIICCSLIVIKGSGIFSIDGIIHKFFQIKYGK